MNNETLALTLLLGSTATEATRQAQQRQRDGEELARGHRQQQPPSSSRRYALIACALIAGVVAVVVVVHIMNDGARSSDASSSTISTRARQVVQHSTVGADEVNDVIRQMGIGSCWTGVWSWNSADGSYMPVARPEVVDCATSNATQRLSAISDDCRGTSSQMNVTQRARFDGQAHCLILKPSEGMCLPARIAGNNANYAGFPIVCDSPSSPNYPSLFELDRRLASDNDSCDTNHGLYYLWFDALDTGFCYRILN